MPALRRAVVRALVAAAVVFGPVLVAAAPSHAATAVPEAPWGLSATAGVDGITLRWFRGSVQAPGSTPTSYVIHRRGADYDADWVVSTDRSSTSWSYADQAAPVGVEVAYTVTARNSGGDSPESSPISARVPVWAGPYDPARTSLTLVWDQVGGIEEARRSTVVADLGTTPALAQDWDNGGIGFSAGSWRKALVLPPGVQDGRYAVGSGDGQLALRAMAGDFCTGPGGTSPSGEATVARSAPSLTGGYASVSVDATLDCENGHTLRAELRWRSPEETHLLSAPDLTVLTAEPQTSVSRDVAVTNAGSAPVVLGSARLVDADISTAAPLSVVDSTCEGTTLQMGATCTLTLSYAAGGAGAREGNGILVLVTDRGEWELGGVVGQQPAAYSGPQAVSGSSSPGRVDLSWRAPDTLDSRLLQGWRVEDVAGDSPRVLQTGTAWGTAARLTSLPVGQHALRVVLRTKDGRESASAPTTLAVASRWLLVTTATGVHAYDADGGATNGGTFGPRKVTADGIATSPTRQAVIVADGPWGGSVRVLGATGVQARTLTIDPDFADTDPHVSPDGSRVALLRPGYTGAKNRPSSLVVVPTAGGSAAAVPKSQGLSNPVWTLDGAALLATADDGAGVVRIELATGARTTIPGTKAAAAVAVSATGRLAYALTGFNGSGQVRATTVAGGSSTLVGTHAGATDLSWDPTGRWLAATGAPYEQTPTTSVFDLRTATPALARRLPGGSSVDWLVPVSASPMASVTSPSWTPSAAALTVGASDADDAPGGLHRTCQLDGGAWVACGATWRLTGLAAGQHVAAARVSDPSGQVSPIARRTWSVDTQAPTVALGALPSGLTGTGARLTWTGKDSGGSSVSSVDVRYRYAPLSSGFGALTYPTTWRGLKGSSVSTTLAAGRQYCFSARARDGAGNTGAWSAERCTSVTLDDRTLTATGRWTRGTHSADAYGTFSRASSSGASLTHSSVQACRIALVVTTCPTCGAVEVYHAGTRLGRVSLSSSTTAHRQVRWLPQSVSRTGNLVVRTTSAKSSVIDGVVVAH
jgi:hypothetical protein